MAQKLTFLEILTTIAAIIRVLVFDVPSFAATIAFGSSRNDVPIPELLKLFFIRRITTLFPYRVIRYTADLGLPDKILQSTRYGPHGAGLFAEVNVSPSDADIAFRGRWIVNNSFKAKGNPADADIVIFYLHGGGYFSSSTATYLLFLLRLAENILRGGKTISIFALEYDLAPERRFPWQLQQARAAYDWLTLNVGVASEKLLVMGDSAGGNLALSLLVDMWKPRDSGQHNAGVSKPGLGLMLLSPWLSLHRKPHSFDRNEMTDVLTGVFLEETALRFVGRDAIFSKSPYLEFLEPKPTIVWDEVLPEWVWVSAGKNEILYDDIVRWIVNRGSDCTGKDRMCGEVYREEAHAYAWLATTDALVRNKYLSISMQAEEDFDKEEYAAIDRMGQVILERFITKFPGIKQ